MEAPGRIVYLHGFASGPQSRKARFFAERLREHGFQVDVPTLDGGDFAGLTITRQLRMLDDLIGGERVGLIGSSLGGYIAALYAARHSNVNRAVLLAPAFDFRHLWETELGPDRMQAWRETGEFQVFHYGTGQNASIQFALIEDAGRYEPFPDCHQCLQIFHGEFDPVVRPELSKKYAREHPNARLTLLSSGHELTDVMEVIWPEMLDFFLRSGSQNEC